MNALWALFVEESLHWLCSWLVAGVPSLWMLIILFALAATEYRSGIPRGVRAYILITVFFLVFALSVLSHLLLDYFVVFSPTPPQGPMIDWKTQGIFQLLWLVTTILNLEGVRYAYTR